jgi:parallel beta-helix repeat protein
MKYLPLVFLVALWSSPASAASRYVDNSGSPACSDSTAFGTEAQPWCTIGYGVGRISSGDDLFVKKGTYNEEVYVGGPAGSATKNTVIRTYPGHIVTIRGFGNTGRVKISATSYITFDGFTITNFNQGIHVDGGSHHVVVQNNIVHDVGQEGIHVKENSSFVTVQGNTVYNTEKLGGCCNGEGVYVGTSTSGGLDNTNNVTVRNNVIHDTSDEGIEIKPGTHDCIVENNTVYITNTSSDSPYAAIEINERDASPQTWSGNPNHLVRNNILHDNKNGIRLGTGSTAYNNVVYNTQSGFAGIRVDNLNGDGFSRSVYHNTIHMTSNAVQLSGGTTTARNNIGPATTGNLAFNAAYFVNAAGHNYHLVAGSAPIDAGADLSSLVKVDADGSLRLTGSAPDLGAYEFLSTTTRAPAAPTNVRIVP